ncbi:transposase [Saccharicrinis sp. GN24d3]|uniref:transposase n=1 Tax=Saccharicrinis sp. GN24d3 TaxID=3458416 RepID=UPI0040366EA9
MNPEKLQYGKFYHIYSHGVGNRNMFKEAENYAFFLHLYDKHIFPVADTYAWVLMPNHVHFVVRIKSEDEIVAFISDTSVRVPNSVRGKNDKPIKIGTPSQQFAKLFNAYAQSFNKWIKARGPLFERPFKRKQVDNMHYLKKLVLYIHNNPVRHGFCEHPLEYPWSSYLSCISVKPTKLKRDETIGWFDTEANFNTAHGEKMDFRDLENWLEF